jgi:hypothetical protein
MRAAARADRIGARRRVLRDDHGQVRFNSSDDDMADALDGSRVGRKCITNARAADAIIG